MHDRSLWGMVLTDVLDYMADNNLDVDDYDVEYITDALALKFRHKGFNEYRDSIPFYIDGCNVK